MCLAIPMQIKTVQGFSATCEAKGVEREVSLFMLQGEPVQTGDHVLVHVGYAIQKVTPEEARSTWELLDEVVAQGPESGPLDFIAAEGPPVAPDSPSGGSGGGPVAWPGVPPGGGGAGFPTLPGGGGACCDTGPVVPVGPVVPPASPVPEAPIWSLLLAGLAAVGTLRRRRG